MNAHLKQRLIDVATVIVVGLVFWAVYSGYVLIGAVNRFYTNQCGIVQAEALEKAVAERLRVVEGGDKGVER